MSKTYRTYLISYTGSGLSGRFFHQRDTEDDPTIENIESMEKQIAEKNEVPRIAVVAVSRIGDGPWMNA